MIRAVFSIFGMALRFYFALLLWGAVFVAVLLLVSAVAGADPLHHPGSPWPSGLEPVGAERRRQRDAVVFVVVAGSKTLRVCSCTGPELVRFCVCVDRLRAR